MFSKKRNRWASFVMAGIVAFSAVWVSPAVVAEAAEETSYTGFDGEKYFMAEDDLLYHITSDDTVEVYGYKVKNEEGDIVDHNVDLKIEPTVTYDGNNYTVDGIAFAAFSSCDNLKSIDLPSTIKYIGDGNYYDYSEFDGIENAWDYTLQCSSLEKITVAKDNEYYESRDGALYVTSGGTVGLLAYPAGSKADVYTIPKDVTWVEINTLEYAYNITKFEVSAENERFFSTYDGALCDTYRYEDEDGDEQTEERLLLYPAGYDETNMYIAEGITEIDDEALDLIIDNENNNGPKTITLSSTVKWINSINTPNLEAFKVDSDNEKYTAIDGVLYLGDSKSADVIAAYPGGKGGSSYAIPDGVITIDNNAFLGNDKLTSITLPQSIKWIRSGAFGRCDKLANINIPTNVINIGNGAFAGCNSLKSVNIPGSVQTVGERVFKYCENLVNVSISEGVRAIGKDAFLDCPKLISISLPSTITMSPYVEVFGESDRWTGIGDHAFGYEYKYEYTDDEYEKARILDSNQWDYKTIKQGSYSESYTLVPGVTIHAPAGSYAETWAKNNGITVSNDTASDTTDGNSGSGSSGGSGGGGGGGGSANAKTVKNADGSTTTSSVTKTAAGTTSTTTTRNADGSSNKTVTTQNTDGSSTVTETRTASGGSTIEVKLTIDGSSSTVTVTNTDASKKVTGTTAYTVSGKSLTLKSMDSDETKVDIPASVQVNGETYKVTKIAAGAFSNNKKLTNVTIGKNVKTIGKNAFKGDSKLKSITIKGKLSSVGKNAFKGINKKAAIKIDASKKNFKTIRNKIIKSGISNSITVKRI